MKEQTSPKATTKDKGPNISFPPPLIFFVFALLGFPLNMMLPLHLGTSMILKVVGSLLLVMVILFVVYIKRLFDHNKTHIEPWRTTHHIITQGVYRYSRNPIYLSFSVFFTGLALIFNNVWILISIVPSLCCIHFFIIKKEEGYLEEKFGQEYLDYKNKVRRWL